MKDLVMVPILYVLDFVMNLVTLGKWGRVRGEERVNVRVVAYPENCRCHVLPIDTNSPDDSFIYLDQ